jgi:3-oxoacyl-[acyl-carrier-protein] synthase II
MGAITPLSMTSSDMWSAICQGKSGIDTITEFDPAGFTCKIAGQVPDFKIRDHIPKSFRKSAKLMSRDIELAIIAADEAIRNSGIVTKGIDPENINVDPTRFAINLGAGLISCNLVELAPAVAASITDDTFDLHKWGTDGLDLVTPLWLLKYLPNMLACHIGIIHDIQGPSNSITCAEASGHIALAEAVQTILRGSSDIALTGGAESKVNPIVFIRQCLNNRATTQNNDDPKTACRPFDADAKGSVFGEAAGIMVIESLDHAQSRDADILAEIVGLGQSNSLNPNIEKIEADGKGIQIAIEKALADAEIAPDDLDLIIPHGTGIPHDDLAEATAIKNALGSAVENVHVLPTKSMLSNTGAAGGALDLITAVCCMIEEKIPAAINCDNKADGCELNIPAETVSKKINYALSCSYTYGGQTAAVVIKNFND